MQNPRMGHPIYGSPHSLPRPGVCPSSLPFPPSPFQQHRSRSNLFVPSYLVACVVFLQPWLYRSLYVSLQLFSSKNCSTCGLFLMCSWWEMSSLFSNSGILGLVSKNSKTFKLNFGANIIISWVIPCATILSYSGFGPQLGV